MDGNEFYLAGKNTTPANGAIWNAATAGSQDAVGLQYVSGVGPARDRHHLGRRHRLRNVTIYNNTLYGSTGFDAVGTHGAYQIDGVNALPTTGNGTPVHTLITAGSNSASDTVLLNIPTTTDSSAGTQNGANVMYTVFDGSIEKFYFNGTTNKWTGAAVPVDGTLLQNAVDIVAQIDPNSPAGKTWIDLWVSDPSGIYSYVDESNDPLTPLPASAFAQIATPDANGAFYGLAFAPTAAVPEPASISLLILGAITLLARMQDLTAAVIMSCGKAGWLLNHPASLG